MQRGSHSCGGGGTQQGLGGHGGGQGGGHTGFGGQGGGHTGFGGHGGGQTGLGGGHGAQGCAETGASYETPATLAPSNVCSTHGSQGAAH